MHESMIEYKLRLYVKELALPISGGSCYKIWPM